MKSFLGIPKKDWRPVLLYMAMLMVVYFVLIITLPSPWGILTYSWILLGQGVLVKYKAINPVYPKTVSGSALSFLMALIWPKYCFKK